MEYIGQIKFFSLGNLTAWLLVREIKAISHYSASEDKLSVSVKERLRVNDRTWPIFCLKFQGWRMLC